MRKVINKKAATVADPGIEEIEIHPTADLYPMMDEEALADLARDIEAYGLLDPIVRDQHGRLIDGRNRREACNIAKVPPIYETRVFADEDTIDRYIFSKNSKRRDLKKGQHAMIFAFRWPGEPNRSSTAVDRSDKQRIALETRTNGINSQQISEARYVYHREPSYAEDIRIGKMSLDLALELLRKQEREKEHNDKLYARIQAEASPDILRRMEDGNLSLDDAVRELEVQQAINREVLNNLAQEIRSVRALCEADAIGKMLALANEGRIEPAPAIAMAKEFVKNLGLWLARLTELRIAIGTPVSASHIEFMNEHLDHPSASASRSSNTKPIILPRRRRKEITPG